jgi:hypothetical protein
MSKATTILSSRVSGISLFAIRWANPSAIAVLPTPASPTKSGLFFRLLHRICTSLSTSTPLAMYYRKDIV